VILVIIDNLCFAR